MNFNPDKYTVWCMAKDARIYTFGRSIFLYNASENNAVLIYIGHVFT